MKISPLRNGFSRKRGPGEADHDAVAGCVQLEPLEAGIAVLERAAHPFHDRLAPVAHQLRHHPLMDDAGVEAGLDGIESCLRRA